MRPWCSPTTSRWQQVGRQATCWPGAAAWMSPHEHGRRSHGRMFALRRPVAGCRASWHSLSLHSAEVAAGGRGRPPAGRVGSRRWSGHASAAAASAVGCLQCAGKLWQASLPLGIPCHSYATVLPGLEGMAAPVVPLAPGRRPLRPACAHVASCAPRAIRPAVPQPSGP